MITNSDSGTNIDEVAAGIYRINTPVALPDGSAFNFNQYLIADDEPLLFHTGLRALFPLVQQAIASVLAPHTLRHIAFSHFEADECGALNDFLAIAPHASAACGAIGAMVSIGDFALRAPRVLADGEVLQTGQHTLRWFDLPHVPHGWDCGLLLDDSTRTLFCGDLFTQGGRGTVAVTEADILGPSEAFRKSMDYYTHAPQTAQMLERLAQELPGTLACMHGSAWRGDGASLLRELAAMLGAHQSQ